MLLVAKPELLDPNFAQAVLVVAPDERGAALGVILNRPADQSLARIMEGDARFARFVEPIFVGGPVERLGLFAVFRAPSAPGPALRIADDLWLALMPQTVERLIAEPPAQVRFYVGYAGWAPGQLAAEIERGAWWTLEPDVEIAFRPDTRGMWQELVTRASTVTTGIDPSLRALPLSFACGRDQPGPNGRGDRPPAAPAVAAAP